MERRVRRALLAIFVLGCLGTGAELLLLGHDEKPWQWTPLGLIGAGLIVLAWHALAPARAGVRAFQALMLLFAASGLVGTFLHYRGNVEFELEMHPEGTRWELFRGAVTGATPALAPGTMTLLGSIGLLYTYRHPALGRPAGLDPTTIEERT
ncbi:MAG TPA: hypothetical protein VMT87_02540 [Vicinamibacteria bacterium]|nr:hypothetical protein [Vicinamibacteria bacterium]